MMKIGSIIRQLRQNNDLTLEDLSKKSGMALATLSRIENDKMTGTLASHLKISRALGVTLAQLYSDLGEGKSIDVQKKSGRTDISVHKNKFYSEILTSNVLDKKMMPVMIRIQARGSTNRDEGKIGQEKFVYVVEGNIEALIDSEKYNLNTGDTLYFNASLSHQLKNTSDNEARCICVVTPSSL